VHGVQREVGQDRALDPLRQQAGTPVTRAGEHTRHLFEQETTVPTLAQGERPRIDRKTDGVDDDLIGQAGNAVQRQHQGEQAGQHQADVPARIPAPVALPAGSLCARHLDDRDRPPECRRNAI